MNETWWVEESELDDDQKKVIGLGRDGSHLIIAYSDEFGHLFRGIPATCSEDNRPPVPRQISHLVGAKRRWYFIISQSLFC